MSLLREKLKNEASNSYASLLLTNFHLLVIDLSEIWWTAMQIMGTNNYAYAKPILDALSKIRDNLAMAALSLDAFVRRCFVLDSFSCYEVEDEKWKIYPAMR